MARLPYTHAASSDVHETTIENVVVRYRFTPACPGVIRAAREDCTPDVPAELDLLSVTSASGENLIPFLKHFGFVASIEEMLPEPSTR